MHDGEGESHVAKSGSLDVVARDKEIRFPTVKLREWPFGLRDDWAGAGQSTWLGLTAVTGLRRRTKERACG